MCPPNYRLFVIVVALLWPLSSIAQQIVDYNFEVVDNKIEVSFSLVGDPTDLYNITLFSSSDGFKTPLKLVAGDVGENIVPGKNKKIVWEAQKELVEFEGELSVKIRAELIPFLDFHIEKDEEFKRSKTYTISWKAYEPGDIKLELYKGSYKVVDITSSYTDDSYKWYVPKGIEPGHDYSIKASGAKRHANSQPFTIKRKVPLIVWALPVVVGGTVAIILINKANQPQPIELPVKPN